jgi:hypothetical protein
VKEHAVNKAWHDAKRMPENPSRAQRVEWHAEHSVACGCRAVPESLAAEVKALNRKKGTRSK